MPQSRSSRRALLGATALAGALSMFAAGGARAEGSAFQFDQPAQPLAGALRAYSATADEEIMFADQLVAGRKAPQLKGAYTAEAALMALLDGTGLAVRRTTSGVLLVERIDADPQGGSAAGAGAEVEALIVTAQKREEDIQDVPIAISAFTQESLERSQIAGGPDLMTQVPNMTFTKTNFSSYSIQIRGIGTQAISATTDPAVAVAFNNTPFVRNSFFEQEFYDLQRIEVLRGPQGTLYGRNATAGVVNIISAKPKFVHEAKVSGDLGNYATQRLEGMVNIPLVEDAVALRLAGAWTKRDGYVTNQITGSPIDGRDLWSTRLSLRFAPSDALFDANLIWEHFEESDDRLRSGKQLCKKHRPSEIGGLPINVNDGQLAGQASSFSQGCAPVSLYSPEAFQTPNGYALPYYQGLQGIGLTLRDWDPNLIGVQVVDPYLSTTQSRDLRVIESTVDPEYTAKSDVVELQLDFNITDNLTLASETSYSTYELFSLQDLNRFNTTPGVFGNSTAERVDVNVNTNVLTPGPNGGGIFCDPQIGCSDRLVAMDLSTANSTQFSEELRLGSDFGGPLNFSLGANFLRYDTMDKYYVFINTLTLTGLNNPFEGVPPPYVPNVSDNRECMSGKGPWLPPSFAGDLGAFSVPGCLYIDPNPVHGLNDQGHNYFLSKNPYKLVSYAVFGELYYDIANNLKLTGGLRWTVDHKSAPRIPSMLLAANNPVDNNRREFSSTIGYAVDEVAEDEWREPTGRLTLDWKPELAFTDETLLYASYAHGYKAGGANPPPTAIITYGDVAAAGRLDNFAIFPRKFDAEFVDAYEVGAKNALLDGALTLNSAAFYYDYKNYQVSEIVERSALNRNFDATVWGLEIEADWRPVENLKLSFKGGYEKTRIADGERAIDLMDRTAGNPDWVVVRPFPATPSNCVLPVWLVTWNDQIFTSTDAWGACAPVINGLDPVTWLPYVPNPTLRSGAAGGTPSSLFATFGGGKFPANYWAGYPGYDPTSANNSTGFYKELGGNELPNAPDFTATFSADYTVTLSQEWLLALHTDLRWQSDSWWRIFNDLDYNRLESFATMNLAAIFTNEEAGWNIMAYIKNVTDKAALTGAFLYSDDVGLTTNVFLTEPRLYGVRVTKAWSGGSLLGNFGGRQDGPRPFTLEVGGQAQRHDAPSVAMTPTFTPEFPATLDPFDTQNEELDWGDGRDVKLIFQPGQTWKFSAGVRFGKTNGSATKVKSEKGEYSCGHIVGYIIINDCDINPDARRVYGTNYSDSSVLDREEHRIADFSVGREFGFGDMSSDSAVSFGIRHAELSSTTNLHILGIPHWDMPPSQFGFPLPTAQHTEYDSKLVGERKFEGLGPILSFEGARPIAGNKNIGNLDVNVSLEGGVLFGDRDTRITGSVGGKSFDQVLAGSYRTPDVVTTAPVSIVRSESATVPTAAVNLGLSYTIDRMKIGAGYRWERYFDAIDGGYDEAEDFDRTIDGPYFKLSVGFGGG